MTEMPVRRYQQLVPIFLSLVEQRAVVQLRPTTLGNSIYLMSGQMPA